MVAAGIVLAGGRSRRMGADKASLELGAATLLAAAVDLMRASVTGPVVVVHAPGQALPPVAGRMMRVSDRPGADGPLNALATGLAALRDRADAALACAVDTPFVTPVLLTRMLAGLEPGIDVVLPEADGRVAPLPLAISVARTDAVTGLVAGGARALRDLTDHMATGLVVAEASELRNLNTPPEYAAASAETGRGLSGSTA